MKIVGLTVVGALALACSSGGGGRGGGGSGDGDAGSTGSAGSGGKSGGSGGAKTAGAGGSGGSASAGSGGSASAGSGGSASAGSGGSASAGSGGSASAGSGGASSGLPACNPIPKGIVRDFNDTHPDFGSNTDGVTPTLPADLVKADLDADGKPVYGLAGPLETTYSNAANFAQWWRPRGANTSREVTLSALDRGSGTWQLGEATDWWPIDAMLLGNTDGSKPPYNAIDDPLHNELWTFEMVFEIEYQGLATEVLLISTDDDGFLFINNKLAINNGLMHGAVSGSVLLKNNAAKLGLEVGKTYPVHFFMAERNLAGVVSVTARNIKFVNCGARLPKIKD